MPDHLPQPQRPAIAVILARAGSKGVPGKNWAPVAGRPCVAWTIDAARAAACVAHVVVSTDSPPVAEIGRSAGLLVVSRPADLASDTATIDAAARHAVAALEADDAPGPFPPETPVVILYANVPVRPAGLIDRAVALLLGTSADSVQSYAPVGKHHPWWTARVDETTGDVRPWEGDALNHAVYRRQDLPPAHIPDGGVVVVTRRALFRQIPGVQPGPHGFLGVERRGIVNPEGAVVDIDTPIDLVVADAILRERNRDRKEAGTSLRLT